MSDAIQEVNIDPWTYYDYKQSFKLPGTNAGSMVWKAPSWVGDHSRRLAAYRLLDSYCRNSGREWLQPEIDLEERLLHREYGDANMMVEAILSSLLGDQQLIKVEGVVEELADASEREREGSTDAELLITAGPASDQQTLMDQWAADERFLLKLIENEKTGIRLGDEVYVLGWDEEKKRPRLRVFDPGFYFPVLDDWDNESDWPKRVHIAWEYEKEEGGKERRYVRRITWELKKLETPTEALPWTDKETTESCFMSEYEWLMDDLKGEVQDFSMDHAIEIKKPFDMGIDFIPVVHIPNTVAEHEHYGVSSVAAVMQVFDDLQSTDTDLQAASATTGTPPMSAKGQVMKNEDGAVTSYGPGTVLESEGGVELLDTSRSLDALLKYKEALQDRLSVNGRTPNTLIGRIDPSKVPSGIVLTLSFQPHSNMIRQMRLVRKDKYDLLFKFVCRFYQKAGILSEVKPVHLEFGSYLPADKQETSTMVQQLLSAHAISQDTAVRLLMSAGFPIEDALLEVDRIRKEDYATALQAVQATADINWVRTTLLGLPAIPNELLADPNSQGGGNEQNPLDNPLNSPDQIPPPFA